jgi:hypothetical protein
VTGTAVYWDWPGPISTILIWEQPHMICKDTHNPTRPKI